MASPSFIDAWASAFVFVLMSSSSSDLMAPFRAAIAFSMAVRSASEIFEPCSETAFSVEWIRASPWFLASASSRAFLSSEA